MTDIVKIDGVVYDVLVLGITRRFEIGYSANTGETLAAGARKVLDPKGTFYSHSVQFKRVKGHEDEYDALFDFVSYPRYDPVPVEIVHGQDTIAYEAFFTAGEQSLKRVDTKTGVVYWDTFTVEFSPIEAQIVP